MLVLVPSPFLAVTFEPSFTESGASVTLPVLGSMVTPGGSAPSAAHLPSVPLRTVRVWSLSLSSVYLTSRIVALLFGVTVTPPLLAVSLATIGGAMSLLPGGSGLGVGGFGCGLSSWCFLCLSWLRAAMASAVSPPSATMPPRIAHGLQPPAAPLSIGTTPAKLASPPSACPAATWSASICTASDCWAVSGM